MISGAAARAAARHYWTERHTAPEWAAASWCQHYWSDWQAPHRQRLVQHIADLAPSSVLELGAHCGPNLRLLRHTLGPAVTLAGVDVNLEAVTFGRMHFADDPLVTFQHGPFDAVEHVDERYDVVMSCYALAYEDPAHIEGTLARAWALARRAMVLTEPMVRRGESSTIVDPAIVEWAHDYEGILNRISGRIGSMTRVEFAPVRGSHLNGLVVARKG